MPRLPKTQAPKTPDQELAHHLEHAENHLISAVELFGKAKKPSRSDTYVKRLTHAQETVTSLYTEELVRIRGPIRPPRIPRRKKK